MSIIRLVSLVLFASTTINLLTAQTGILPPPGSTFRESTVEMTGNDWRVTDPDVEFERGEAFLPNPQLVIPDVDLDGAVRAELVIDYWAGHPGTTNPRFRLNKHKWVPLIVELAGADRPVPDYTAQLNLRVDVPLDHLQDGHNLLSFKSATEHHGCQLLWPGPSILVRHKD